MKITVCEICHQPVNSATQETIRLPNPNYSTAEADTPKWFSITMKPIDGNVDLCLPHKLEAAKMFVRQLELQNANNN